jgi:hypothetical protein
MRDSVDWSGLEVTGQDNLVDGWWTAGGVVYLVNASRCARALARIGGAPDNRPQDFSGAR